MKKKFSKSLFGYKKIEVLKYIDNLRLDYEDELAKKKNRLMDLNEENRNMKNYIKELESKLEEYKNQEKYISKALVKAEQKAQGIIEDGQKKAEHERYKIELEKARWKERVKGIRSEIIELEKNVWEVMERFRDDINFLASKELSEALLEEEYQEQDNNTKSKTVIA